LHGQMLRGKVGLLAGRGQFGMVAVKGVEQLTTPFVRTISPLGTRVSGARPSFRSESRCPRRFGSACR
jgi:hypothetical protein